MQRIRTQKIQEIKFKEELFEGIFKMARKDLPDAQKLLSDINFFNIFEFIALIRYENC